MGSEIKRYIEALEEKYPPHDDNGEWCVEQCNNFVNIELIDALHMFEALVGERNCCAYIIEGIEDLDNTMKRWNGESMSHYIKITVTDNNTEQPSLTIEFNGRNGYCANYWGKMKLPSDRNEWGLQFDINDKTSEIKVDSESRKFVKYIGVEESVA